jgi:signal transduction histidine kinase
MNKKLLLLWLLIPIGGYAQPLDSLLAEYHTQHEASSKRAYLASDIGNAYRRIDKYDSALFYLEIAVNIAEARNLDSLIATTFDDFGIVQSRLENNDSAMWYFEQATEMCQRLPHDSLMVVVQDHIGTISYYRSDHVGATKHHLRALSLYDSSYGISLKRRIIGNLGETYLNQGDIETAIMYLSQAIDLYRDCSTRDSSNLVYKLILIGRAYGDLDSISRAERTLNQALAIAQNLKLNRRICDVWSLLGIYHYLHKDQKEKALQFWEDALALARSEQYTFLEVALLTNIGGYYANAKQYEQAIEIFNSALKISDNIENISLRINIYNNLAEVHASLKQYQKAYQNTKVYIELKDSVLNTEKQREIATLQAKFDTEKRQREIHHLEEQQALQAEQLERRKFINRLLEGGIGFAIFFIGVMTYFFVQLRKKNSIISQQQDRLLHQNQQLQTSEKQLKDAYYTQSRFFSIIAHDLRSPLSNLRMFLSMLQACALEVAYEKRQEYLKMLSQELVNVELLLDNLLHWAIDQQGAITFKPRETDAMALIDDSINLIRRRAEIQEINIVQHTTIPTYIYTDADMLAYILRNLLANAIKFTPPAGQIKFIATAKQNSITIEVFNTGSSISDEEAANLFKLRTKPGMLSKDKKGVGLGLYLSKQFARKMGGHVWVKTQPESGVSFFLSLPIQSPVKNKKALVFEAS